MADNNNSNQLKKAKLLPDIDYRDLNLSIQTIKILEDIFADGGKIGDHTKKSLFEKFPKKSNKFMLEFLYELGKETISIMSISDLNNLKSWNFSEESINFIVEKIGGVENLSKYTFNELIKTFEMDWLLKHELEVRLIAYPFVGAYFDRILIENRDAYLKLLDITSNKKNFAGLHVKSYPEGLVLVECYRCLKLFDIEKLELIKLYDLLDLEYYGYRYLGFLYCGSCKVNVNFDKSTYIAINNEIRKMLYPKALLL